jgi:hypothetical protein
MDKPIIKAHTHLGEKLMTKNKLGLMAIVLFLTIAGATVFLQKAMAQKQDKIEYNTVYDCGDSRPKFKVLSCKGDICQVYTIKESAPGGGYESGVYRNIIEDTYIKREGCKTKNSPAVRDETEENETSENETPVKDETDGAVACSASSADSDGKTANEKTFRGVIRRLWEKEAQKGADGAVTVTFQKVVVGAPRAWRANLSDAYSQADPKKPIYPVRATFATCTDYNKAISKRKMERIYDCFVHKTGGWQCTQTGASGALATKDEKEYIQKQQ